MYVGKTKGADHCTVAMQLICICKKSMFSHEVAYMSLFLRKPGPEVIKNIQCSIQLSMKFFLLMNVEIPTNF